MELTAPVETDALVVGAGPVGLFQVFELGLLEIRAHVVDSLPYAGGQCVELYGDKPIYDIPALTYCTGRELAGKLLKQVEPFGATFHFNEVVSTVQRQADGRFLVGTAKGKQFLCKVIVIAAGVGAFLAKSLKVDGLEKFEGTQIVHRVDDDATVAGRNVVVVGDEEFAVETALRLHGTAKVTLLHRRDVLRAEPATEARLRERVAAGAMQFAVGQVTGFAESNGRLAALKITAPDASTSELPADTVVVALGLSPKLGPVAHWGLALERKQLQVDTEKFGTSEPGIFAVGDINTYPGKKKLIVCGFHEATLAAFGAAPIVYPDRKVMLQYTTTSPRLHELLGVETVPRE